MESTGFETEAYKLMISDIYGATKAEDGEAYLVTLSAADLRNSNSDATKVRSRGKKLTLRVSMIWIQGTVTEVTRDELMVTDRHGESRILGYNYVPGGDHSDIQIGTYIGILGQIVSTKPDVQVKAFKIMCLKNQGLLDSIWEEEVKDLKAFLLGLMKPQA